MGWAVARAKLAAGSPGSEQEEPARWSRSPCFCLSRRHGRLCDALNSEDQPSSPPQIFPVPTACGVRRKKQESGCSSTAGGTKLTTWFMRTELGAFAATQARIPRRYRSAHPPIRFSDWVGLSPVRYQARGLQDGFELDDWAAAEREVLSQTRPI